MKQLALLLITALLLACGGSPNTEAVSDAKAAEQEARDHQKAMQEHAAAEEADHGDPVVEDAEDIGLPPEDKVYAMPNFEAYLADNERILATQMGDLNRDEHPDWLLATYDGAEDDGAAEEELAPRRLSIIINNGDDTYSLAASTEGAILCKHCGGMMGDPFTGLVINKGYFSIEHYGGSSWRWTRIITFKYNKDEDYWYLHKDGGSTFHAGDPEETMEEKVQTTDDFGLVPFAEYHYEAY